MTMRAGPARIDPTLGRARADRETLSTAANLITGVRTVAAVVLAMVAAQHGSLTLLLASLATYWVGDMADGAVARLADHETRIGAVLDILSDRLCAAAFYVGLAWLEPELWPAVAIYLVEFMVVDAFVSLGFLAWPLVSPNYFFVVDRRLWLWNWSKPGKAVNSAAFALLLVVTGNVWIGAAVAVALLVVKTASLLRLARIGLPIPAAE
ncbi:MAG TPA: CDP-alcohol phosphatidyltransferase family protein [Nocardioidaceae bacterium]|nr:CDP-alcohol phosphatidyltransferase family protein [Nocardioidaceae bacterium]